MTIDEAIKTALAKEQGYVNSAMLGPAGPPQPGLPPKLVWTIHVVTEPATSPVERGKGDSIIVDGETNTVVEPASGPSAPPKNGG